MSDAKSETKDASASAGNVLNINIGVLGHVDSGKTSLSTIAIRTLILSALISACNLSFSCRQSVEYDSIYGVT